MEINNNKKGTISYTIRREISIILHINGSGWHDVETLRKRSHKRPAQIHEADVRNETKNTHEINGREIARGQLTNDRGGGGGGDKCCCFSRG